MNLRPIALVIATGVLAACVPDKPDVVVRTQQGGTQRVAFVVDDESFTVEDVHARLEVLPDWARARFSTVERKKNFLASLAQFELLVDEAEERGYDEHPATLDRYEAAFAQAWIDEQIRNETPDKEDLRELFERDIGQFRRGEARVTYILQTPTVERAQELRRRINASPPQERFDRFRRTAQTFSLDRPSGRVNGLVGAVTEDGQQIEAAGAESKRFYRPPDEWTGEFLDVPWQLEEGEVSEPIVKDGRWLLVMWRGLVPPEEVEFEDVADEVRAAWDAQRRDELMAQFRD